MERAQLMESVVGAAHLTGRFELRSGQISDHYFDKYRFEADPKLLCEIATAMRELIPPETEVLAGLELGGVPIATALALETGLPAAFVRKERKAYGTCRIAEGHDVAGKHVCIVEDVITTGGQVAASAADLREEGAVLVGVVCAIYRGPDSPHISSDDSLTVHALFTQQDLLGSEAHQG